MAQTLFPLEELHVLTEVVVYKDSVVARFCLTDYLLFGRGNMSLTTWQSCGDLSIHLYGLIPLFHPRGAGPPRSSKL